jgi:hypothetical protein
VPALGSIEVRVRSEPAWRRGRRGDGVDGRHATTAPTLLGAIEGARRGAPFDATDSRSSSFAAVLRESQGGHLRREGLSKGSVSDYQKRARVAGLTWADVESMTDSEVEARLFKGIGRNEPPPRVAIDFEWVGREMRGAGVTLQLLWVEYRDPAIARGGDARPYQYGQFCDLFFREAAISRSCWALNDRIRTPTEVKMSWTK